MEKMIRILAKIQFLKNDKGRQNPFSSGYHPVFTFPNAPTKLSGYINLLNKEKMEQGESEIVEISFIRGILGDNYFSAGQKFSFAEEPYQIGDGEIIQLLA